MRVLIQRPSSSPDHHASKNSESHPCPGVAITEQVASIRGRGTWKNDIRPAKTQRTRCSHWNSTKTWSNTFRILAQTFQQATRPICTLAYSFDVQKTPPNSQTVTKPEWEAGREGGMESRERRAEIRQVAAGQGTCSLGLCGNVSWCLPKAVPMKLTPDSPTPSLRPQWPRLESGVCKRTQQGMMNTIEPIALVTNQSIDPQTGQDAPYRLISKLPFACMPRYTIIKSASLDAHSAGPTLLTWDEGLRLRKKEPRLKQLSERKKHYEVSCSLPFRVHTCPNLTNITEGQILCSLKLEHNLPES